MAGSPSLYKELDPDRLQIRLLRIIPSEPGFANVRCRMETVSLCTKPSFCALSWVWGDSSQTIKILVENDGAAEPKVEGWVAVRTNLEAAMRHVPSHWATYRNRGDDISSFRLWADAICINQKDSKERESQVRMMASIYKAADLVISWLGPDDFGPAFSGVRTVLSEFDTNHPSNGGFVWRLCHFNAEEFPSLPWLKRHPDLSGPENTNGAADKHLTPVWESLMHLLDSSYWERIWIFQEVVLATELLLTTKSGLLGWNELLDFGSIMFTLRSELEKASRRKPDWLSGAIWALLTTDALALKSLSLAARVRKAKWMQPTIPQSPLSDEKDIVDGWDRWEDVLTCTYRFQATDPKDYIFGLLGVSGIDISPDYSTDLGPLYSEFIKKYLDETRTRPRDGNFHKNHLSFLAYGGIGLFGDTGVPTWAPDYSNKHKPNSRFRVAELAAWRADRDVFDQRHDYSPMVKGLRLCVFGMRIEKVTLISKAPSNPAPIEDQMLGYIEDFIARHPTYVSGMPSLRAFFSLFHLDSVLTFGRLGALRALSFINFLVTIGRGNRSSTEALKALGWHFRETFDEWFMKNFFPDVDPVPHGLDFDLLGELLNGSSGLIGEVWHRTLVHRANVHGSWRFFETESGYLGLGPEGARPGDEVYILKNSSVPVIFRGGNCLRHVGTAFVVGLMDGEAVKISGLKGSVAEWLELQ